MKFGWRNFEITSWPNHFHLGGILKFHPQNYSLLRQNPSILSKVDLFGIESTLPKEMAPVSNIAKGLQNPHSQNYSLLLQFISLPRTNNAPPSPAVNNATVHRRSTPSLRSPPPPGRFLLNLRSEEPTANPLSLRVSIKTQRFILLFRFVQQKGVF